MPSRSASANWNRASTTSPISARSEFVQTAKPRAIIDPSPRQNAIAKSVKRQLAYQDARRSAKYRDPGSVPSPARIVEALTLAQIWSAGCTRAITKASRELGAGWRLVQCDSPQKNENIFQNSHQNSHSRKKGNLPFGEACKVLILLMFWWTR
jgi:hypothetical protein